MKSVAIFLLAGMAPFAAFAKGSPVVERHLALIKKGNVAESMTLVNEDVVVQIAYKDGSTSDDQFKTLNGQSGLRSFYLVFGAMASNKIDGYKCDILTGDHSICSIVVKNEIDPRVIVYRIMYILDKGKIAVVRGVDDIRKVTGANA